MGYGVRRERGCGCVCERISLSLRADTRKTGCGSAMLVKQVCYHCSYILFDKKYRGCQPRTPNYFLPTAGESNQREPPPDFVPSYLRRLPAKSPQLALRSATGFRHTDFLNAVFAVNMGHIRNGGNSVTLRVRCYSLLHILFISL